MNTVSSTKKTGALLVNLGSPDSPGVSDVRRYLRQFLMDGRVIDAPYPVRWGIVNLMILPSRPKESAEAYRSIWWEEGSPLIVLSRRLAEAVRAQVDMPIALGMRYGKPSIESAVRELLESPGGPVDTIRLLPLYAHYAMSSYETVVVETERVLKKLGADVELETFPPFFEDGDYIAALVESARPHLEKEFDHLLVSFHGLPERHLRKADPTGNHCLTMDNCCEIDSPAHATCYRAQAFKTTRAFVREAGLPEEKVSVSFQSRLGKDPWLKPYTDHELERLASEGVKKLLILSPAFVSDCLETLEELGIRGKETFLDAGGEELRLIPCLNDHERWVETVAGWLERESW